MASIHDLFVQRCFDLAHRGASFVSTDPLKGALIVCDTQIIGEGYSPNPSTIPAEWQAIQSVRSKNSALLKKSTLYVSTTPEEILPLIAPIIDAGIPKIIFASLNSAAPLKANSIETLKMAGIAVGSGLLEDQRQILNMTCQTKQGLRRPYVILKYARSADGYIGLPDRQVWLSHPWLKRLTHKWRSEISAIMVGTNTAQTDNPSLNTRMYYGSSPTRIVLDRKGRLPATLNLFDGSHPTWIIQDTSTPISRRPNCHVISLDFGPNLLKNILKALCEAGLNSLLIEGGAQLINSFLAADLWDEARVYTAQKSLGQGIKAPIIDQPAVGTWKIGPTSLHQYFRRAESLM